MLKNSPRHTAGVAGIFFSTGMNVIFGLKDELENGKVLAQLFALIQ